MPRGIRCLLLQPKLILQNSFVSSPKSVSVMELFEIQGRIGICDDAKLRQQALLLWKLSVLSQQGWQSSSWSRSSWCKGSFLLPLPLGGKPSPAFPHKGLVSFPSCAVASSKLEVGLFKALCSKRASSVCKAVLSSSASSVLQVVLSSSASSVVKGFR